MPEEIPETPLTFQDQTKLALARVLIKDVGGIVLLALRIPGLSSKSSIAKSQCFIL